MYRQIVFKKDENQTYEHYSEEALEKNDKSSMKDIHQITAAMLLTSMASNTDGDEV